jgi:hypothetical protein
MRCKSEIDQRAIAQMIDLLTKIIDGEHGIAVGMLNNRRHATNSGSTGTRNKIFARPCPGIHEVHVLIDHTWERDQAFRVYRVPGYAAGSFKKTYNVAAADRNGTAVLPTRRNNPGSDYLRIDVHSPLPVRPQMVARNISCAPRLTSGYFSSVETAACVASRSRGSTVSVHARVHQLQIQGFASGCCA